jgi:hypothetical protein
MIKEYLILITFNHQLNHDPALKESSEKDLQEFLKVEKEKEPESLSDSGSPEKKEHEEEF